MSDLVVVRNCCMTSASRRSRVGVGTNTSARGGKKCKVPGAVQRTGYCAI